MFAKVFGQIFDSSIAEDYNCRRMFMDLLVLADPTGAVDMTHDAIARRTNVPIDEVRKYIDQLCQPDPTSRSRLEEGKRLTPLDKNRDWGWQIVNYQHYRRLKDEEARRSYFRNAQQKYRAKKKKEEVQEDEEEGVKGCSTLSNAVKPMSKTVQRQFHEWMMFRRGMGKKPKDWISMFCKQAAWLVKFQESTQIAIIDQSIRNGWQGLFEIKQTKNGAHPDILKPLDKSKIEVPERFKAWVADRYPENREDAMKWRTWADVPRNGLRDEWWREEKAKLPIEL